MGTGLVPQGEGTASGTQQQPPVSAGRGAEEMESGPLQQCMGSAATDNERFGVHTKRNFLPMRIPSSGVSSPGSLRWRLEKVLNISI